MNRLAGIALVWLVVAIVALLTSDDQHCRGTTDIRPRRG